MKKPTILLFMLACIICGITYHVAAITYPIDSSDFDEIRSWISVNIKYVDEDTATYHWQTPEETLRLRTGLCVDYAILLLQWVHDKLGADGFMLLIKLSDTEGHAVVQFNNVPGAWFSPQTTRIDRAYGYQIMYILTLQDALDAIGQQHKGAQ